ncbi:hypothetical protein BGX26_003050 [Mortierella sp. AD094]|nr:hypothetical protein BGX26_003050 [Mortierella sp. AD094]
MEETQSFRLIGKTDIEEITLENADGHHIVYWEDIEQVFPGVKYVKNGKAVINMLRDSNQIRLVLLRIQHYPGVILDVVLSTAVEDVQHDSPIITSSLAEGRIESPTDAPAANSVPKLASTEDEVVQALQVIPSSANTPLSGVTVNDVSATLLLIPSSSPLGVKAACKAAVSDSTTLASTFAPGSSVSMNGFVDQLGSKNEVSTDFDPSEPMNTTLSRRATTHIHDQWRALNAAIEFANRSGHPLNSKAMQELIGKHLMPPTNSSDTQQYLTQNVDMLVRDVSELKLQGNVIEQLARKMISMQQQALDRLALIQSKTEAILNRQLELAEYPIPRLFIVLPEEQKSCDPGNWFRTKFHLHFICECGEHTMAAGSKISHHLHLVKHEGYLIREPTAFFRKYGPFLLLMLEVIKFGTSVAGHVVPALASLKVVELADSVQQTVESVAAKIDYSLECIDKQLSKVQELSPGDFIETDRPQAVITQQDLKNYLNNVEGLEGVELRQLGSFLKSSKVENLLGNLYRMTTKDGHVKWVCRDHYRAGYQEKFTQKLRDVVKLAQGEFDEQLGRIEVDLTSSFAADQLYSAISKARGVLDLHVRLLWNQEYNDFVKLKDMVSKSNIRSLKVNLNYETGPNFEINFSGSRRYDPIVEIMRLPSIQLFKIVNVPSDFFKRSSQLSKAVDLSNLRHLRIGRLNHERTFVDYSDTDIAKLKMLVAKAPNLSSLVLETASGRLPAVFSSIAEHQTYSIVIKNLSLRLLAPSSKSPSTGLALRNLTHMFEVHGAQVETLDLRALPLDDVTVEALSRATQNGSSLRELYLPCNGED